VGQTTITSEAPPQTVKRRMRRETVRGFSDTTLSLKALSCCPSALVSITLVAATASQGGTLNTQATIGRISRADEHAN